MTSTASATEGGFDKDDPLHALVVEAKECQDRLKRETQPTAGMLRREISGNVYDMLGELTKQVILLRDGVQQEVEEIWDEIADDASRLVPGDATRVTALIAFTEMLIEHVRGLAPSEELTQRLDEGAALCKLVQELVEEAVVVPGDDDEPDVDDEPEEGAGDNGAAEAPRAP
jgi:hypothetical protein